MLLEQELKNGDAVPFLNLAFVYLKKKERKTTNHLNCHARKHILEVDVLFCDSTETYSLHVPVVVRKQVL